MTAAEFLRKDPALEQGRQTIPKVSAWRVLRVFLGVLRGHFRRPLITGFKEPFFEASNETKWRMLNPFYSDLRGTCLLPHDESIRTANFIRRLTSEKIPFLKLEGLRIPFHFWQGVFILINRGFIRSGKDFVEFRSFLGQLFRLEVLVPKTSKGTYFCSNDDKELSALMTRFLQSRERRVVNIMHGRAYNHPVEADLLIGFCRSQVKSVRLPNPKTQTALLTFFQSPQGSLQPDRLQRAVFFDQHAFELLPKEIRDQAIVSLKRLLESGVLADLRIQLHPSAKSNEIEAWTKLGFTMRDPRQDFDLGISLCSTVGWDNYSKNIPTLYLNFGNVMANFKQINAFEKFAVNNPSEFQNRITTWVQNPDAFKEFSTDLFVSLENDLKGHLSAKEIIDKWNLREG